MYIIHGHLDSKLRYYIVMRIYLILIFTLVVSAPAVAHAQGITPYLQTFASFINGVLMPFLFAGAFLLFLVNIVRYFILEGASEEGREKAKRNAIWGIVAFVFLFSLWTITTLLLSSLNITNKDAYCPDYLVKFGFTGDCTDTSGEIATSGFIDTTGSSYLPPYESSSYTPSDKGGSGSGSPAVSSSALAELVFGAGRDAATLTSSPTASVALDSTPSVPTNTSCNAAINILQQAAAKESTQAAYIYARGIGDTWNNVTNTHSANNVTYNTSIIDTFISEHPADSIHVFHTHPDSRPDALDLPMDGHGPSRADLSLLCDFNKKIIHHIIDKNGVWTYRASDGTCPIIDKTKLSIIETYIALSSLKNSYRYDELREYIIDDLTNVTYDTHFTPILDLDLGSMNDSEIRNLAALTLQGLDLTINYSTDVELFCSSL